MNKKATVISTILFISLSILHFIGKDTGVLKTNKVEKNDWKEIFVAKKEKNNSREISSLKEEGIRGEQKEVQIESIISETVNSLFMKAEDCPQGIRGSQKLDYYFPAQCPPGHKAKTCGSFVSKGEDLYWELIASGQIPQKIIQDKAKEGEGKIEPDGSCDNDISEGDDEYWLQIMQSYFNGRVLEYEEYLATMKGPLYFRFDGKGDLEEASFYLYGSASIEVKFDRGVMVSCKLKGLMDFLEELKGFKFYMKEEKIREYITVTNSKRQKFDHILAERCRHSKEKMDCDCVKKFRSINIPESFEQVF